MSSSSELMEVWSSISHKVQLKKLIILETCSDQLGTAYFGTDESHSN